MRRVLFLFVLCGLVTVSRGARAAPATMNAVAERYVHLVLALGQHDSDYVDAFYGPAEWKTRSRWAEKNRAEKNRVKSEYLTFRLALQTRPTHRKFLTGPTTGIRVIKNQQLPL